MTPLEQLYEIDGLPSFDLPAGLAATYGGGFGLDEPLLFANFVSTIDGVTAIPSIPGSNKLVAAGSEADRFVMGLLRASADAVVVGSGTFNASPRSVWTAEQAFPGASDAFAELRRAIGRPPSAELVVLSASGSLDPAHPAFAAGALVLTSDAGAERLEGRLPAASTVVSLGGGLELDAHAIVGTLRDRGHKLILSEGGPRVIGALLEARLVNELFLTVSPVLVGRTPADERYALVEGADLLPAGPPGARLLGIRRDGEHLFLRYAL
ncbi:MAG TPA: dihydrofolate reductase family protein [Gaiellaceae bacterium]|nr:dihydrofolate reductase family protein [Gaiellaceae bacterium]